MMIFWEQIVRRKLGNTPHYHPPNDVSSMFHCLIRDCCIFLLILHLTSPVTHHPFMNPMTNPVIIKAS